MYDKDLIDFLEIAYGEGFLSLGGEHSVDEMFKNIDLDNKKILDIGCGIGGVDFYIAKNFNCEILAIDIEPLVIERAQNKLNYQQLKGKLKFKVCEDIANLAEQDFDIIFAKESLLHIKNKEDIFKKIYNALNAGGKFITVDWMHSDPNYSEQFKKFLNFDGLDINLTDHFAYKETLEKIGFQNIIHDDITSQELMSTKVSLNKIKADALHELLERFGSEYIYKYCIPSLEMQIQSIEDGELLISKISAGK